METLIVDEIQEFISRLEEDSGKAIVTQNRFNISVLNALWTIISGERLKHDDPELIKVMEAITRYRVQLEKARSKSLHLIYCFLVGAQLQVGGLKSSHLSCPTLSKSSQS